MSLISCPECDKEVSDQAAACPHCGRDNPNLSNESQASVNKVQLLIQLGGVAVIIYFVTSWFTQF